MANYTGKTGALSIASSTWDVTNWTINTAKPTQNVSDAGSGDNEEWESVGRKSWSGTFDMYVKSGEDIPDEGDSGAATFTLASGKTFTGSVLIESCEITDPVASGESVTASYSYRGTGALTKPTF
jgi:hypothetical protein